MLMAGIALQKVQSVSSPPMLLPELLDQRKHIFPYQYELKQQLLFVLFFMCVFFFTRVCFQMSTSVLSGIREAASAGLNTPHFHFRKNTGWLLTTTVTHRFHILHR